MIEVENPNYYGILPASVRYDKNLKPMEKILYVELTALSTKNGYCNAQNSYFAKLYEVHKNTAGFWINKLEKLGYINSKLIYAKGKEGKTTKQVIERRIYIISNPINGKIDSYQSKECEPVNKNIDTPINEKTEEINNNTSNEYYKNEKKYDYRRHSQNENIQTKEIESIWKEKNLKNFEYSPIEEINKAIKKFGIGKVIHAIDQISKSSYWKNKIGIGSFFNPNDGFRMIKNTLNGDYSDFKEQVTGLEVEVINSKEISLEDLKNTFKQEEKWRN